MGQLRLLIETAMNLKPRRLALVWWYEQLLDEKLRALGDAAHRGWFPSVMIASCCCICARGSTLAAPRTLLSLSATEP